MELLALWRSREGYNEDHVAAAKALNSHRRLSALEAALT